MPTLIIEDGTIIADANSWITLAEWATYLELYGRTASGTDDEKNVMLIKAQRAISTRYVFDGSLVEQTQATVFPRYWPNPIKGFTIASDDIVQDWKDAQSELAWSIHEGSDPFADATTGTLGPLTGDMSKAGPVETQQTYGGGGTPFNSRSMSNYTATNDLLKPYLAAGSNGIQMRAQRG